MGYTHYWKREKVIEAKLFERIVKDFRTVFPVLSVLGVELAGSGGEGKPEINSDIISFNLVL